MLNSTKSHQQNDTLSSSISNSSSSSVENTNLQQNGTLSSQANLKNYLIEKLLNEDESKPVKVNTFLNKSESKEDLISETGTYTIEEKVNVLDKKGENSPKDNTDYNLVKSIDLMSARAAIDETFGIVERPHISNDESKTQLNKRPLLKVARERNKTYSLTADLLANLDNQEDAELEDTPCNTNSLTKTTTYDVIADKKEIANAASVQSDDLDVTATSQISKSSKSCVDTEVLLGNTEQLIETIKKRRSDKKLQLQQRLTIANNNMQAVSKHTLSPSPSSSCSSSIADNKSSNELRSWTISTTDLKSDNKNLDTSRASLKNRNNRSSHSDLDGNISDSSHHAQSHKKGGLAFDYILDGGDNKNSKCPVNNKSPSQRLTPANLSRHRSVARSTNISNDVNSSYSSKTSQNTNKTSGTLSTQRPLTSSSRSSNQSVNRNYSSRRSSRDDYERSSITNVSSGYTTPKSTVSLGAKIKAKATDINVSSPAQGGNTPRTNVRRRASDNSLQPTKSSYSSVTSNNSSGVSPYTNRTLYLRQQSSKAKRESLDSNNNNSPYGSSTYFDPSTKKPLNGILKKTTSVAPNNRISQKQPTGKQPSRSNSRATSPTGSHNLHLQVHQSPLMTSSLNLPSGSALPGSSEPRGSFQRRKNYDPIKAVEQEKQKKLRAKQEATNNTQKLTNSVSNLQQSLSKNSIYSTENDSYQSNNLDYDSMSDSSQSFSIPVQNLKANISDKQLKSKLPVSKSFCYGFSTDTLKQSDSVSVLSPEACEELRSNTEIIQSYEKILQSTLQRLCIRLIQMSTGVLDKIGDENSTESNLLNNGETTELERMQQLAKLVHSMQLVHDHIQIIDSSLFTAKPEEAYMKELSKIRAEVECLKQNAANSTNSSIISNAN